MPTLHYDNLTGEPQSEHSICWRKWQAEPDEVIEEALIATFTRSHALLVGVPGLAKTLLVSSLAQTLHLTF